MRKIIWLILPIVYIAAVAHGDIKNPVMFIGQKILGATVSAPLSADANGQLVSGIVNSKATATASTTTTSATDVLIGSMTLTPAAGTYTAQFQTSLQSNSNNANIFVSIWVGGVQSAETEVSATPQIQGGVTPSLNLHIPITTSTSVTVNGAQAIEARWRTTAGTATALNRVLSIVRLQ